MNSRQYRDALSRYATGVALVTTITEDGEAIGANDKFVFFPYRLSRSWYCGVLVKIRHDSGITSTVGTFAISVLSSEQQDLAKRFATPLDDKFADLTWRPGLGGVPVIDDMSVVFECQNRNQHDAGDHIILVCEVKSFSECEIAPLVYCNHEFSTAAVLAPTAKN